MAAPSEMDSGPASVRMTVTCSPGTMLPTRMVNTSGRSSSAMEARWPAGIARPYVSRRAPRPGPLLQLRLPPPVGGDHPHAGDGRAVGQREYVGGLQRLGVRVDEPLRQ